jgi:predicted nucleic acid-binding protein
VAGEAEAMTDQKRLVLDANILLRAVFGVRVLTLLETYEDSVSFYAPDICFADARKYIPSVSAKRQIDPAPGIAVLDHLSRLVEILDRSLYEDYESSARERMISRDEDDWPIVAAALLLKCPIWTEDRDFPEKAKGPAVEPPKYRRQSLHCSENCSKDLIIPWNKSFDPGSSIYRAATEQVAFGPEPHPMIQNANAGYGSRMCSIPEVKCSHYSSGCSVFLENSIEQASRCSINAVADGAKLYCDATPFLE